MADTKEGFSLRRWSTRKLEARREARGAAGGAERQDDGSSRREAVPAHSTGQAIAPSREPQMPSAAVESRQNDAQPIEAERPTAPAAVASPANPAASASAPRSSPTLPSLDTLTIDSDYAPFMQTGIDDSVKRSALKKLFSDPRFNVMDGLDVYIADYSKPDPISPDIVRTLVQARYIFNPPATRVNEQGHVEDVPEMPTTAAQEKGTESADANASSDACSTPSAEGETADAERPAITVEPERADDLPTIVATAGAGGRATVVSQPLPSEATDTRERLPHANSRHDEPR